MMLSTSTLHGKKAISLTQNPFAFAASSCLKSGTMPTTKHSTRIAARMESTGAPGKIHVSEATAECLRAAGKQSWLSKRTDKVSAKGKGTLQTYWVYLVCAKNNSDTVSQSAYSTHSGSSNNITSTCSEDDED